MLDSFTASNFDATYYSYLLEKIIISAAELEIPIIVIPLIEQMSFATSGGNFFSQVIEILCPACSIATQKNVILALELDLNPHEVEKLFSQLPPEIKINYDTGNSAALGFDPLDELSLYGSKIVDIHIKDRRKDGPSVLLGTGDANLNIVAEFIMQTHFSGPVILQAYRDTEAVKLTNIQGQWFRSLLELSANS